MALYLDVWHLSVHIYIQKFAYFFPEPKRASKLAICLCRSSLFSKMYEVHMQGEFSKIRISREKFRFLEKARFTNYRFSHPMAPKMRNPDCHKPDFFPFVDLNWKMCLFFSFPGLKRASKLVICLCRSNLFFKMYEVP